MGASIGLAQAIGFQPDVITYPSSLISLGEEVAGILRMVGCSGMFGAFLLLLPAALLLWCWLQAQNFEIVSLSTSLGVGYTIIGAIGSAALTAVMPAMIRACLGALEAEREAMKAVFLAVAKLGIDALLSVIFVLGGLWWMEIGRFLRVQRRVLGQQHGENRTEMAYLPLNGTSPR